MYVYVRNLYESLLDDLVVVVLFCCCFYFVSHHHRFKLNSDYFLAQAGTYIAETYYI